MFRIGFALWMLAAAAALAAPAVRPDHPIIGTWKHPVADICTEVRTYRTDGTLHVTSGEEVSDSTYEISDQPNLLGAYALTETLVSVNSKPDCWGAVAPPGSTGVITQSIGFNAKRDQMKVCGTTGRSRIAQGSPACRTRVEGQRSSIVNRAPGSPYTKSMHLPPLVSTSIGAVIGNGRSTTARGQTTRAFFSTP